MQEELASLGTILTVTATASVLKQELNPEDLMQTIIDEYDRQSTRSRALKEKGGDIAFYAEGVT